MKNFDYKSKNFWEVYPELAIPSLFSSLYKSDKSKNKKRSSSIMWAMHLYTDPEGPIYNIPNKDEMLAKDFIEDKTFKWEDYQDHLDLYKEIVLSPAEQALHTWNEMIKERNKLIKALYNNFMEQEEEEKDIKLLSELDKMLSNTSKLFKEYKDVKADFEKERVSNKSGKMYEEDI